MSLSVETGKIDVVILCGGEGKRLRPIISGRPKPMCEFGGRPFLSILMEYIASFGFRRFILCTGYMGGMVKKYYSAKKWPWEAVFSQERIALGTGGAVKKAYSLIKSSSFLVMNGDSFCRLKLDKFKDFHFKKKALLSIALTDASKDKNCGKVILNSSQRIVNFTEKGKAVNKFFANTGIYFMDKKIFSLMPEKKEFSLEYNFFPSITGQRCYGFKRKVRLIDFGTISGYRNALHLLSQGYISKRKI